MLAESQRRNLHAALLAYRAADAAEREHVRRTIALLAHADTPFSRHNAAGHITASAIVWDERRDALLMILHPKFDQWYQPGGHCEPDRDTSIRAAALRELVEETHLSEADVESPDAEIVLDVDVHAIPALGDEPAHDHHDLRYWFRFVGRTEDALRPDIRWVPRAAVLASANASLARAARKLRVRRRP